MTLTPAALAATLDATNLRLDATADDIRTLCLEALQQAYACVMIYPTSVALAARVLSGSDVRIGTVVGFPSGRMSTQAKAAEIACAAKSGAHEVDIVMHYAALRDGTPSDAATELHTLTRQAHDLGLLVKVITENCYLAEDQILAALQMCEEAGADFIKTSTGFGSAGANATHIALWAKHRTGRIKIKAAGGIRTLKDAEALLAAGADRIGTSNARGLLSELQNRAVSAKCGLL
ncbi:MAG TPA: deoxyribose-phosphate aldolase [Opitutaceae bacterium]|jgi:deoxyribose-phosphate aldolase|nr:deoxyribose-phosphate aldolase [Opitutaceae bacterium]HOF10371.1 deoxyribose-phosphate aldolase [Opitutaceae bacterium]HOR25763.1 deoxyribose-phosphate aldolase [Opitutaceae bacterium]HPK50073.1 deoxyribose-phosphate aldolase [Opitutaceae bacterium]